MVLSISETEVQRIEKTPRQIYMELCSDFPIGARFLEYLYENNLSTEKIDEGNFNHVNVWEIIEFLSKRGLPLSNRIFWEEVEKGEFF